jgi:CrcB protein
MAAPMSSSQPSTRVPPGLVGVGAVLAGGLIGSLVRATIFALAPTPDGGFPTATLAVNLIGSLLLGFYLSRRQRAVVGRWSLQFWAIGVLGSLTTFSAFSVEVVVLVDGGAVATAAAYVGASILGGLFLAAFGERLGGIAR